MRITFFDVLFLLAMVGGGALGWYRGLFRSLAGTLIIYISTVISTIGYRSIARIVSSGTGSSGASSDVLAFIVLMGAMNVLLRLMSKEWLDTFDAKRLGIWVNITGMVFGFLNLAIVCSVLLIILRSATDGVVWFGYQGIQEFFRSQTHGSFMAYVFSPFMRFLLVIIQPWLFGHSLPPLLVNAF